MMTTSLVLPDTTEQWPQIEGRREPEHLSIFDGSDELGDNALTLAQRIGSPPMPWQVDNVRAILRTNVDGTWTHPSCCIICPRQNGKALDVETPILTTAGWSTMGALQVGDEVFHPDGHPTRVTHAFDTQYGHRCFEVTTADGRKIVADADHLWTVQDRRREIHPYGRRVRGNYRWETLTTQQLLDRGLMRSPREFAYRLPRQHTVISKPVDLPMDPYLFGVWLGDGCSRNVIITVGDRDLVEMTELLVECGTRIVSTVRDNTAHRLTINIAGAAMRDGFMARCRRLGVWGNKHIPAQFLTAGTEQRLALLQGLLDTDGSISAAGQVEFCNTNRNIADGALYLARSLGWRATLREARATLNGRDCGPKYRVQFTPDANEPPPFRLRRKAERVQVRNSRGGERHTVSIRSIVEVPSRPVRCIKVDRPDGLFLAGDGLVATHNSEFILVVCLYMLFVRNANIVFSTQQWKTARKLAIRFQAMIKARPDLKKRLACQPTLSQGQSLVTLTSGAEMIFCTRSGDTGKGLDKVDLVIYDEAYNLTEAEMTGPTLAQMAAPNPQTIYTSSAVFNDIHPNGAVLAGIRRNGLRKAKGLYFAEYMAPEPGLGADGEPLPESQRRKLREDPAMWRAANPSFGVIQTDAKVQKAILDLCGTATGRRSFEVDVLGWGDWPVDADVLVSEIPADKWDAMGPRNGRPKLINSPAVGLHREGGLWVVTGAQYTDTGRVHLEIGYSRAASSTEVVTALVELVAAWDPVAVAIKRPGDAAALEDELVKAGVEPEMVGGGKWAQWCGGFLNAALGSKLSHSDQSALNDAAAAAVKHELPAGGFIWDEDAAASSSAALCSATLAHGALLAFGQPAKRPTVSPRTAAKGVRPPQKGPIRRRNGRQKTDFDVMSAQF